MIELGKGTLFFGGVDFTPLAFGELTMSSDIPISDKEEQPRWMMLDVKKDVGLSFEIKAVDFNLLEQASRMPTSNNFTLTYEKQIMIQARWHKRNRTNKKWLKRYGMKPDTVNVSCDANTCAYDVIDGSFDIDASSFKYNLKPHQKRRNIKIEL